MISVFTSKEDNVYGEGEEIALNVVYTHAMDVLGTPTIPLLTPAGRRYSAWEDDDRFVMHFGCVLCT